MINDLDEYIIIASDGLWDVIEDQQAINLLKEAPGIKAKARALIDYALKHESQDNVTVFIARLN